MNDQLSVRPTVPVARSFTLRTFYGMCFGRIWSLFVLALAALFGPGPLTNKAAVPPIISGFVPQSGNVGALVVISGSNLIQILRIEFNGVSAPIFGSTEDGTAVQTQVPSSATSGRIRVVTESGAAFSSGDFEVGLVEMPLVTSFTPRSGPAGTEVTISGSNLVNVTQVEFNGAAASFSTMAGIVAIVPTNASTGPITVATRQGSFTTLDLFSVTVPAVPVLSGFAPDSGPPGTFVELSGSNLVGLLSISFNGVAAQFTDYGSGTERHVGAIVPLGASTGPIHVITKSGAVSSERPFTVTSLPAPVIDRFSPSSGPTNSPVVLTGKNFNFVQSIKFSGIVAPLFTVFAPDSIQVLVPQAPSGPITLTTAGGSFTTATEFTITDGLPAFSVAGFAPVAGPPNQVVNIELTHSFGDPQSVRFNGVNATFERRGKMLLAVVPAEAVDGPITVTTTTGSAISTNFFSVYRTPEIGLNVSPMRDPILLGSSVVFSMTVTNLSSAMLENLQVTNSLASGQPTSGETVVLQDGWPQFGTIPLAHAAVLSVTLSQGTFSVADGTVVCHLGNLYPGARAQIEFEVEPHLTGQLHFFPLVVGGSRFSDRAYSCFLSTVSVETSLRLTVRQITDKLIELTWPLVSDSVTLMHADNLLGNWNQVEAVPQIVEGHNSVVVPNDSSPAYYILRPAPP